MGGGTPDLPLENYNLSFISKKKKLVQTSLEKQSPPSPSELSGSAHACPTVEFYFLFVAGLDIILSRAN